MNFEIVESIPYLNDHRGGYCQKVLPTNFTISSPAEVLPEHFYMMRWCYSGRYLHPTRPELGIVDYEGLKQAHIDAGGISGFIGTSHEREAIDIEYWDEWRDENLYEWNHMGNYRILFEVDGYEGTVHKYLGSVEARNLQYALAEKVRDFTKVSDGSADK